MALLHGAFPNPEKVLCFAHSSLEDECSSKLLEDLLRNIYCWWKGIAARYK